MAEIVVEEMGDDQAAAVALGLLIPGKNLKGVAAALEDEVLRPILAFDSVAGTVTCFHPDVGLVTVPAGALRTWQLDTARLAEFVGRLLGLPASFRPTPLVDGVLWDLGNSRLDRAATPILFARRLADEVVRGCIRNELELHVGKKPSVLLTSDRRVTADLALPAVSVVVAVADAMDRSTDAISLNLPRLAALAKRHHAGAPLRLDLPVDCETDGHWLKIDEKTYNFRGTQARIVRRLYEAWAAGNEWLREQAVLEGAESGSTRLTEAFKGKPGWKDVIEVSGANCRLRVPQGVPQRC